MFELKCMKCGTADKTVKVLRPGVQLCERCVVAEQTSFVQHRARLAHVILATGDLHRDYDIVDVVMTLQADQRWDSAWGRTVDALRGEAIRLQGHAVINIRVEHHTFAQVQQGFLSTHYMQGIEFFATGTVVRFRG